MLVWMPSSRPASSTNGLNAEPGLALAARGDVELALGVVRPGHHRPHLAGARLDGDQRRRRAPCPSASRRATSPPVSCSREVERRVDLEAAGEGALAVLALELLDDVVDEVGLDAVATCAAPAGGPSAGAGAPSPPAPPRATGSPGRPSRRSPGCAARARPPGARPGRTARGPWGSPRAAPPPRPRGCWRPSRSSSGPPSRRRSCRARSRSCSGTRRGSSPCSSASPAGRRGPPP